MERRVLQLRAWGVEKAARPVSISVPTARPFSGAAAALRRRLDIREEMPGGPGCRLEPRVPRARAPVVGSRQCSVLARTPGPACPSTPYGNSRARTTPDRICSGRRAAPPPSLHRSASRRRDPAPEKRRPSDPARPSYHHGPGKVDSRKLSIVPSEPEHSPPRCTRASRLLQPDMKWEAGDSLATWAPPLPLPEHLARDMSRSWPGSALHGRWLGRAWESSGEERVVSGVECGERQHEESTQVKYRLGGMEETLESVKSAFEPVEVGQNHVGKSTHPIPCEPRARGRQQSSDTNSDTNRVNNNTERREISILLGRRRGVQTPAGTTRYDTL
ncbi:hypothetical protein JHW43_005023 [Diplocarpon mali]|nr:hypothetical protein JHW43_005023 [Diplocarpon mali]